MLTCNPETFHKVEATIAILRDLIIFFLFSLYLKEFSNFSKSLAQDGASPEKITLYLYHAAHRFSHYSSISIGIYTYGFIHQIMTREVIWLQLNLIIYLIEILITEIVPIGSIGITRLTGSMQKTAKSEDVAQFLAIS
ncbi:hypothetical protein TVAGG3_0260320 [Trichomonas vaginalis G3]|uniref:hypothetical protein n=1 Tax=Trichomonas vaginalis (strain ATCC PRA-98 / G3) TaxID=412133 RepID=UPI0021E576DA|nr:hypothetical protein TVAGG3_0260320 [Trichomonas vaginalis G3]KAI5525065.1 hypothetical protein TVAGG3_0260320 [Trichomonas vaginalis G3]